MQVNYISQFLKQPDRYIIEVIAQLKYYMLFSEFKEHILKLSGSALFSECYLR